MSLLDTLFRPVLIAAVFFLPPFVVGIRLLRHKQAYRAAGHEPFTRLPLRPPGESLRLRIEELNEQYSELVIGVVVAGALGASVTTASPPGQRWFIGTVGFAVVLAYSLWAARKLFVLVRRLWDCRLGFAGERAVGEELNQLLASGFHVFHDVPFDTFNIDHVLVGPAGLFVVETKTRRKPADIKGPDRATVVFDGTALQYPKSTDTNAVEQARRNARTLEDWLSRATGERVNAGAILTIPGWFVVRKAVSDVKVLNPDEIRNSFPDRPKHPLSPEQIIRISHPLQERCRMTT